MHNEYIENNKYEIDRLLDDVKEYAYTTLNPPLLLWAFYYDKLATLKEKINNNWHLIEGRCEEYTDSSYDVYNRVRSALDFLKRYPNTFSFWTEDSLKDYARKLARLDAKEKEQNRPRTEEEEREIEKQKERARLIKKAEEIFARAKKNLDKYSKWGVDTFINRSLNEKIEDEQIEHDLINIKEFRYEWKGLDWSKDRDIREAAEGYLECYSDLRQGYDIRISYY